MEALTIRWLLPCALALLAPVSFAQDVSGAAMSDPKAEASPVTTSLQFNSTLAGYQAYTEQAVGSWREANDTVGRIGGWRAYAREAAQPDSAAEPMSGRQDQVGPGGKR